MQESTLIEGTFEVLLNNIIDNKDIVVANEPSKNSECWSS